MTQSVYSWMGSPLHLVLDDEFVILYNRAADKFLSAQTEFRARTGSSWNGNDPLEATWTQEEIAAFNKMADLVNFMVEFNGGSLHITEEQITSDFLVKL